MKLYPESNQTIAETARNLGLKESTLANWVKKDKDNEAVAVGEAPLTPAERTRIRELEADVRRLNMENVFLKKAVRTSRARTCEILVHWPGGGRAAGAASRVRFPVVFMCRMLEVTRQGYYEWKKRLVSAHDQKDVELAARIRYLHQERHKNRAGIERILWDLQEEGYVTSERRVRRLARAAGLQCVHPGPSARTTVQDSKAIGGLVDLVDRQFTAPEPDQLWVGDITYIWTYSGFAYLATLIDMCSNKVVGWAVDDHMRTGLVLEALDNALAARGPGTGIGELVAHHDRGSQYTSGRYRDRLFAEGIIPSVGHTGICHDNAAAESFNATIKKELIYQHVWRDAGEVRTAVFDYIERYYNHVRKQRRLGKISRADYELRIRNWT